MSSFPDDRHLTVIVDRILRHADSLGLNEQELPRLRRLFDDKSTAAKPSENSNPSVAAILNDARAVFSALRQLAPSDGRRFSRIHLHTLGFHAIVAEANGSWPNGRAAIAKAALTSNRHTCGSREIDPSRARLIMDELVDIGGRESKRIRLNGRNPAVCWIETTEEESLDIEVCIAPVLVCKKVVQTVGGGDNVSAAGLVLQI
jgi:ADP-dependent glucokinase